MKKIGLIIVCMLALSACQSYAPIPESGSGGSADGNGSSQGNPDLPQDADNRVSPTPKKDQPNAAVLALRDRADSHVKQQDFEGAAASLERAIRISPRDPDLYFSLARVRLLQENNPQAAQLCRKAVSYAADRRYMELKCEALLEP